ncbi:MAG: hypothetical protein KDJ16_14235 [Hyphomicrobiales bacterium]|nr:hypothetical protein [Hyphomicrobiales bacterium]
MAGERPAIAIVTAIDNVPPQLRSGDDAGYPGVAFLFNWATRFHVAGGDANDSGPAHGFVVQKVDGRKTVRHLDGRPDLHASMDEILWESFAVVDGETDRADMIQLVFQKDRVTTLDLKLAAGFQPALDGASARPLHPRGEIYGAEFKLDTEPAGFAPTLFRTLRISVQDDGVSQPCWQARVADGDGRIVDEWPEGAVRRKEPA